MAHRCSTICLPIGQEAYSRSIDSPKAFRDWLDRAFREAPERFPAAIARGYRLGDARRSARLGIRIRRIR